MVTKATAARRIEVVVNDGGDIDLLTVPAAAAILKVSKSSMWKLVRNGDVPSVTIASMRRIRRVDLAAYIDSLQRRSER